MKKINVTGVDNIDLKLAYKVISIIMDNNQLNSYTSWRHVKSELAMAIADNVI